MNGRCKNDPLDTAEEVCGICGDEFCSDCLIIARIGKKKLVCKGCAVDHSGLRAGQKSKVASKHRVRKQKRSLKASAPQGGNEAFTFFDDPGSNFEHDLENAREAPGTQVSSASSSDGSKKKKKRRGKSESVKASTKAKPTKDASKSRLGKIAGRRKNNLVETAMAGPTATTQKPAQDIPAPTSEDVAFEETSAVAQVETVATDPPPPGASEASAPAATVLPEPVNTPVAATPVEASSPSAADLLNVLKADEAAAAVVPTAEGAASNLNLETSPFSDPFADPSARASGVVEPITGEMPLNSVPAPASGQAEAAQRQRRSPGAGTVSGQGRQSRSNISDPFAAGSAAPFDSPATTPQPEVVPQDIEYEPVAFEAETPEPVSIKPQTFEPVAFEPVAFEPVAFEPVAFEPVALETATPEPATFTSSLPLPTPPETGTPEPVGFEPQTFEPIGFEPQTFEPDSFETQTFEPDSFETQLSHTAAPAHTYVPEPVLVSTVIEAESHADSTSSEPSEAIKANTDSNGEWVPPLLRGMAPVAEREGLPLPHRRSED